LGPAPPRWRQRLVGRKGAQFHALTVEQLAYAVSVDKLVFAVDVAGERYLLETPLAELEAALDPQRFFRANRQVLLAADAVAVSPRRQGPPQGGAATAGCECGDREPGAGGGVQSLVGGVRLAKPVSNARPVSEKALSPTKVVLPFQARSGRQAASRPDQKPNH
jgi:hypothetical protein